VRRDRIAQRDGLPNRGAAGAAWLGHQQLGRSSEAHHGRPSAPTVLPAYRGGGRAGARCSGARVPPEEAAPCRHHALARPVKGVLMSASSSPAAGAGGDELLAGLVRPHYFRHADRSGDRTARDHPLPAGKRTKKDRQRSPCRRGHRDHLYRTTRLTTLIHAFRNAPHPNPTPSAEDRERGHRD